MAPKRRQNKDSAPPASTGKRKGRAPVESNKSIPLQIESSSSSRPSTSGRDCPPAKEAIPIIIHGQKYYKAEDLARKRKGRTKTSHIWEKGFEIIHAEDGSKHYYCRLCLDKKEDPTYKPLVVNGNLLQACPLPTVSGNGITFRGNLWVTPGVLRRGKAAGNTSCLRLARQTFSLFFFFLLFSFTILSLATKLITFHSLLACVCSICARL